MWYLIISFLLLLITCNNKKEIIVILLFLVYTTKLTIFNVGLIEYSLFSILCLVSYIIYKYEDLKSSLSIVDTAITCSFKLIELIIIVYPSTSYYLPNAISSNVFSLDYIFLIFILWSIIMSRVDYKIKTNLTDYKNFYLLCLIVVLNMIAYIF